MRQKIHIFNINWEFLMSRNETAVASSSSNDSSIEKRFTHSPYSLEANKFFFNDVVISDETSRRSTPKVQASQAANAMPQQFNTAEEVTKVIHALQLKRIAAEQFRAALFERQSKLITDGAIQVVAGFQAVTARRLELKILADQLSKQDLDLKSIFLEINAKELELKKISDAQVSKELELKTKEARLDATAENLSKRETALQAKVDREKRAAEILAREDKEKKEADAAEKIRLQKESQKEEKKQVAEKKAEVKELNLDEVSERKLITNEEVAEIKKIGTIITASEEKIRIEKARAEKAVAKTLLTTKKTLEKAVEVRKNSTNKTKKQLQDEADEILLAKAEKNAATLSSASLFGANASVASREITVNSAINGYKKSIANDFKAEVVTSLLLLDRFSHLISPELYVSSKILFKTYDNLLKEIDTLMMASFLYHYAYLIKNRKDLFPKNMAVIKDEVFRTLFEVLKAFINVLTSVRKKDLCPVFQFDIPELIKNLKNKLMEIYEFSLARKFNAELLSKSYQGDLKVLFEA
ncbi:MAG: hypothetical protein NTU49_02365, partial [Gammaproteobacteria bacterium]|nr:hypothetical protein [Gammaproteobacteria bacterium]